MESDDKQSYVAIRRVVNGEFVTVHTFPGDEFDKAHAIFNRMKKTYDSLPEFQNGYFTQNYSVARVFHDSYDNLVNLYH